MKSEQIVRELQAERRTKQTELDGVEAKREALREEVKRATRVIEMLDPSARPAKPKKQSKGGISKKRAEQVLAAIRGGAATTPEIAKATGINSSSLFSALDALRTRGLVRKAGRGQGNGGQAPNKWAVIE